MKDCKKCEYERHLKTVLDAAQSYLKEEYCKHYETAIVLFESDGQEPMSLTNAENIKFENFSRAEVKIAGKSSVHISFATFDVTRTNDITTYLANGYKNISLDGDFIPHGSAFPSSLILEIREAQGQERIKFVLDYLFSFAN